MANEGTDWIDTAGDNISAVDPQTLDRITEKPNGQSEQFDEAKASGLTWEFEGKEYAMFHANSTGNIGMPIVIDDRKVGIVIANFDWSGRKPKSEVFLNHLKIDLTETRDLESGESKTHSKNFIAQNCDLFRAIVQSGEFINIDRFGKESEPKPKTHEQMCAILPETQSELINTWLKSFHIERYFGTEDDISLDALLGEIDTISFKCSIGDKKNPAHVLLFHFNPPPKKIRQSYDDKRIKRTRRIDNKKEETFVQFDNSLKIRYAKDALRSVEGAFVTLGGIDTPIKEGDDALQEFKNHFNPEWFMDLADALHGTFSMAGK